MSRSLATHYLLTPMFLVAMSLYFLNRLWLKPAFGSDLPFLHNYLDDLLFFPVAMPILIAVHEILGLRSSSDHPTLIECILWFIVWSCLFEIVFPALLNKGVADPLDVLAYVVGVGIFIAQTPNNLFARELTKRRCLKCARAR